MPAVSPSLVLAALVGVFTSALYVLVRGRTLAPIGLVGIAAILGAWAGDAIGGLAGLTLVTIGDFRTQFERRLSHRRAIELATDRKRNAEIRKAVK